MMGKTHMAVGIASALALIRPKSLGECMVAVIAGSIGGIAADSDTLGQTHSYTTQKTVLFISLFALAFDFFGSMGICESIMANPTNALVGVIIFVTLFIFSYFTHHRTFTHSLLALMLYSMAFFLIYRPFVPCFMIAYLSHLLLDMLNKRDVPILYPVDFGICLNLCPAGGKANTVLMYVGGGVSAVFIVRAIILGLIL